MELITESSLNRILQHNLKHDIGIITAFRDGEDCGKGRKYTKEENIQRNKSLKAKLLNYGYDLTQADGFYVENYGEENAIDKKEEVFIVVDIKDKGKLEKHLRELGEEFEQDSIMYIPKIGLESIKKDGKSVGHKSVGYGYLWGTNHCSDYPGYGKSDKFDKPIYGETGEFYTRINGRRFVLKFLSESMSASGFFGKMGVASAAKKNWKDFVIED